jgi:hypothetical protein
MGFYLGKAYAQAVLPVGIILTLAAAVTEMNGNSVITTLRTLGKIGFTRMLFLHPVFSILDPWNPLTVPKSQLANGCVDILSHLFECFIPFQMTLRSRMAGCNNHEDGF